MGLRQRKPIEPWPSRLLKVPAHLSGQTRPSNLRQDRQAVQPNTCLDRQQSQIVITASKGGRPIAVVWCQPAVWSTTSVAEQLCLSNQCTKTTQSSLAHTAQKGQLDDPIIEDKTGNGSQATDTDDGATSARSWQWVNAGCTGLIWPSCTSCTIVLAYKARYPTHSSTPITTLRSDPLRA